jgi:hypothetical protein
MKTHLNTLARGPQIMRAAENDQGAEAANTADPKPAEVAAIDPAKYQNLASAHDRLKKDAAADRAAMKELNDRLAAYDAEKANAEEAKAREAGDYETVKKQLEARYGKEVETRDGTITKQRTQIERLVIDAGLAASLAGASVSAEFLPAVTALLRQGVEIRDDDDGNPAAYRSGVPLAEAVKLWAENDGRAFIRNGNTGGDAKGGQGAALGAKTITRDDFAKLGPVERAKAARELKIVD